MNVYDKAYELKKALQVSPQAQALRTAKEKVDADPTQKKMLEDFLTRQFELQQAQLLGQKPDEAKLKQFEDLTKIIGINPNIREYLAGQMALGQVLADIQKIIGEAIEDLAPPLAIKE